MKGKRCKYDCLNCELPTCKHDLEVEKTDKYDAEYRTLHTNSMISEKLRLALFNKKMRQKELAITTTITEPTISCYVRGARSPRADHIVAICKALDISADWLLGLKENE